MFNDEDKVVKFRYVLKPIEVKNPRYCWISYFNGHISSWFY